MHLKQCEQVTRSIFTSISFQTSDRLDSWKLLYCLIIKNVLRKFHDSKYIELNLYVLHSGESFHNSLKVFSLRAANASGDLNKYFIPFNNRSMLLDWGIGETRAMSIIFESYVLLLTGNLLIYRRSVNERLTNTFTLTNIQDVSNA